MNKVKVTYRVDSPIKQKVYYDVLTVNIFDCMTVIHFFDHVREEEASVRIKDYLEIEIF